MKIPAPTRPQILLVDDNQDGLLARKSLLEELGYCVQIANTAEEGLKLFESTNFDVVVTDYRMPGMNGAEFIGQIRKINANARVILLSGFVEPLGLTESNTAADIVIEKSANEVVHLLRAVKRLINRLGPRKPPAAQRGGGSRARANYI